MHYKILVSEFKYLKTKGTSIKHLAKEEAQKLKDWDMINKT